ncbi:hypothetical protein [Vibrio sp. 16]|uniref:hypothetical protein n=1 Tax=Vibrio sp. 16 TaxID=391586 RepID=UPI00018F201F|nr:hypothetical protein [Vibrio sp. 16]EED26480.1 response regulator [Vibrio sp. 16]USN27283.1 hypothetical protein [synthetic construct]CAK4068622.1 Transcriptional regulator VspR [Vibrio sp. 16]
MKETYKIDSVMSKLLIDNEMDGFSVVKLRDEALKLDETSDDIDAERKRIYRQILRFLKKGWLRSQGEGRSKIYFVTDEFKALQTQPKDNRSRKKTINFNGQSILREELRQSQGELEIALGEIDEYQSLIDRFPELVISLGEHLSAKRIHSARLLGKVNALSNALNSLRPEARRC